MKGLFSYDSPIMGALTTIGDCICVSVLWLVFSLPIVTLGASTTALYDTAYHVVRRKEGALLRTFLDSFRTNFKRSTLIGLVALAVLALLTVDVFVMRAVKMTGRPSGNLYYAVLVLWCLAVTWCVYMAAYAARFNGTVREVLKFGLQLMALHPIRALTVLAVMLGGTALTLLVPFMLLILPGAEFALASIFTERVFRAHMRPEDLEREEKAERDPSEEEIDDDQ